MTNRRLSICVVDDEETIRLSLGTLFSGRGHHTICASTGQEALEVAEQQAPDVMLLDLVLPDLDGIEVLRGIKRIREDTAVIMVSARGSVEVAVAAMKEGAESFVTKPVDLRRLEALVETVGKYVCAEREVDYYRRVQSAQRPYVGVSGHAHKTLQLVDLMAKNADTTVLIFGESGTGKGVVASLIHERSARRDRPFIDLSCAELSAGLLESELFGHERGAFTDAKEMKKGLVEVANGGTLFLDEVGELDLGLQPKLLRVLESRTIRRVGGVRDIRVDVRIIAATNMDVPAMVKQGRFREDLYYRLKVMPLELLPLRERKDDIPALVEHFIATGNGVRSRRVRGVDEDAMERLTAYSWPGNIRELRNVLERAVILTRSDVLTVAELPTEIVAAPRPKAPAMQLGTIEEMEQQLVARTLEAVDGNRTHAARNLGISRSTLLEKMRRYQLS